MELIILLYAAIIGSFLNVCIYRIPHGMSIVFPRSFCPNCQIQIKWFDLVPIISFLFLRGRCRSCKAPISIQYPVVEALTAVLTLVFYRKFGLSGEFFKSGVFCCLLMVIAWIDYYHQLIPNRLSIFGLITGLAWATFYGKVELLHAGLGAITGGGILFAIAYFFPQGMGMGDVKLLAMIGAFLGVKGVLYTLFIGSGLGAVIGLVLIYCKVIARKNRIPFAPFLAVGAMITLLFVL
jgi:leader peptidase (prepilin peptidase)/N-methyltransferase